jgi:uncharacterized protein YjiS (DUF1127 family)
MGVRIMRLQPFQTRTELGGRKPQHPTDRYAGAGIASGEYDLRIGAIFKLPATWWQRARFRAKLRADLAEGRDFLRDIGIGMYEARMEVSRFFWEPIALKADSQNQQPLQAARRHVFLVPINRDPPGRVQPVSRTVNLTFLSVRRESF